MILNLILNQMVKDYRSTLRCMNSLTYKHPKHDWTIEVNNPTVVVLMVHR